MEKYLKSIVKRIVFWVNTNFMFRKNQYLKEINKRKTLPYTSIFKLSKHISILSAYSPELHPPNDFYGQAKIIKRFTDLPVNYQFKFVIEHGIVLSSNHINQLDFEPSFPSIVTMGMYRSKLLARYWKKVYSIGPYIHYSPHFLDEINLKREKKRLGKTLLVLPSHSTLNLEAKYDLNEFCKKLDKIATDFKTIRVCLYWKDILNGVADYYKSRGFECVTAGHIFDPLFLPRLKSIIETSTMTMSNDPGTHVGYCIYMKKPHYIIPQQHTTIGLNSEKQIAHKIYQSKPYQKVLSAFTRFDDKITKNQLSVIDCYWGLSCIKNQNELLEIINESENIYRKTI